MHMDFNGFKLESNQSGPCFMAVSAVNIAFSKNICMRLGCPEYVQLYIHEEKRQIIIKPCEKNEPQSFKFADGDEPKYVFWNRRNLCRRICNLIIEYDPLSGQRAYIDGEYYDEDNLFLFNTRKFYTKSEKNLMLGLD